MSDQERLRSIAEREQQATKGPWKVDALQIGALWNVGTDDIDVGLAAQLPNDPKSEGRTANAQFIAHAREDVPYLLSLVARQAQEIAQLQADRDAFHMDYRIKSDQQSKAALVRAEQAESEVSRQAQEIQDLRPRLASALAEREEALLSIGGVQSDLRKADREIQDLRTERDQREASLKRIHARFGATNADGECDCPYCRRDAEALGEMTADYELREWKASQRAESAEASRDALREALKELRAVVLGECPSLLNEDSGGDARLALQIDKLLAETPTEDR
jgi:DNA repair exonuclease SbcCD ATPase subunit